MKLSHLPAGRIINTHGFRGTVKLESWCDSPQVLAGLKRLYFQSADGYLQTAVCRASVFKQFVLMDIEGIDNEERANALRGVEVFAAREDLPLSEGDFFIQDLLGLPVRHADSGELLGTLKDVNTSGARDLYVVQTPTGEYLVPAVPELIPRIDPDDAVYVRPIEGLLGEAERA